MILQPPLDLLDLALISGAVARLSLNLCFRRGCSLIPPSLSRPLILYSLLIIRVRLLAEMEYFFFAFPFPTFRNFWATNPK
jgi:hypothetical protein